MSAYEYIETLQLNLAIGVPHYFIEIVFDFIIQTTMAIEFAHNNGLIHGDFDLSKVLCIPLKSKYAGSNHSRMLSKVTEFNPGFAEVFPEYHTEEDKKFLPRNPHGGVQKIL